MNDNSKEPKKKILNEIVEKIATTDKGVSKVRSKEGGKKISGKIAYPYNKTNLVRCGNNSFDINGVRNIDNKSTIIKKTWTISNDMSFLLVATAAGGAGGGGAGGAGGAGAGGGGGLSASDSAITTTTCASKMLYLRNVCLRALRMSHSKQ